MHILPYDTFTLETRDSLLDVIEKLKAKIGSPRVFREDLCSNQAPYAGKISSSGFKLRRIRYNETPFLPHKPFCLPYIQGRFELLSEGIIIHLTLRIAPDVTAFLLFCFFACYSLVVLLFLSMETVFLYVPIIESFSLLAMPISALLIIRDVFRDQVTLICQELTQIILEESQRQH